MKCKATVNSIRKAYPCYNQAQVESLFRKLGIEVITPKMAGDLRLGSKTTMDKGPEGCQCGICVGKRVIPQDRMWALIYAFGLKKQTILKFVSSELLKVVKKRWADAPKSLLQYLKTGKGDKDKILEDIKYTVAVQHYWSLQEEVIDYVRLGCRRAYRILRCTTHISITRQRECIKQLVKLCESQK
jgi:hypothetical protein